MVVARNPHRPCNLLVLDRRLQHHAFGELVDQVALDLLPRRLVLRDGEAAVAFQLGAALRQFLVVDENVRFALVEVDADAIAGADERKSAAGGSFRRGVQDRRRAGGSMFTTSALPG